MFDKITVTHAEDCIRPPYYSGDEECEPNIGQWCQPPDWAVTEARLLLDDDAPWCRIHEMAWEIEEEESV